MKTKIVSTSDRTVAAPYRLEMWVAGKCQPTFGRLGPLLAKVGWDAAEVRASIDQSLLGLGKGAQRREDYWLEITDGGRTVRAYDRAAGYWLRWADGSWSREP